MGYQTIKYYCNQSQGYDGLWEQCQKEIDSFLFGQHPVGDGIDGSYVSNTFF